MMVLPLLYLLLLFVLVCRSSVFILQVQAIDTAISRGSLSCDPLVEGDEFCVQQLRQGSICHPDTHLCTNPFFEQGGCLSTSLLPSLLLGRERVCNSDDHQDEWGEPASSNDINASQEDTHCRSSPLNYTEIRIHAGSWDSSLVMAWIYQIVLSERLDVPVTIMGIQNETTQTENHLLDNIHDKPQNVFSFYNRDNAFTNSQQAYPWEALQVANALPNGDCRWLSTTSENLLQSSASSRLGCAHVLPEIWTTTQQNQWQQALQDGVVINNTHHSNFQLYQSKVSWYIPKWTAQQYPNLVSYYGLANNDNLDNIFLQPWTWGDYCQFISDSHCGKANVVAQRRPQSAQESTSYFVPGLYSGYFGNSTTTPSYQNNNHGADTTTNTKRTSVGHAIAPSSCDNDWAIENLEGPFYWHNISLQSQGPLPPNGGYERQHMIQIWMAANTTKSHVMMVWFAPDSLIEMFRGSDFEFQAVIFPECTVASASTSSSHNLDGANDDDTVHTKNDDQQPLADYCSLLQHDRVGSPEAACDYPINTIQPAIASSLWREQTLGETTADADASPALQVLQNIRVTNADMQHILKQWGTAVRNNPMSRHSFGYEAREAVCSWVVDHLEELDAVIPQGFPPNWKESLGWNNQPQLVAAQAVGGIVSLFVLLTLMAMVHWRKRRPVVHAQFHFVMFVLIGFWFLTMAAVLGGKEPSDTRCLLGQWLSSLGFTMAFVPLLVKIATINYTALSLRKGLSGHISISTTKMFLVEIAFTICAVMYLMVWTAYDPPRRLDTRVLHIEEGANYYVDQQIKCYSSSDGWVIASLCWQTVALCCTTLVSFLSGQVLEEFMESKALEVLIYCQDLFLVARIFLFLRRGHTLDPVTFSAANSFLLSFDAFVSVAVYFIPILLGIKKCEGWTETFLYTANVAGPATSDPLGSSIPHTVHSTSNVNSDPGVYRTTNVGERVTNLPTETAFRGHNSTSDNLFIYGTNTSQSLGMGSASSSDISAHIQAHMSISTNPNPNHVIEQGLEQEEPITAECRHGPVATVSSCLQ